MTSTHQTTGAAPVSQIGLEPLWTVEATATYFGISDGSLRNMMSQGRLPIRAVRIGRAVRFRAEDVQGYVTSQLEVSA